MIRAFIAIDLPNQTQEKIGQITHNFVKQFPQVRWELPEKMHITLAFLGALPDDKVNSVRPLLHHIAQNHTPFELTITDLSYFYKKHEDSLVYLDVVDREKNLQMLYRTLQKELENDQYSLPQRFTPHVTIGKLKRLRFPHEVKKILYDLAKFEIPQIENFSVTSIGLFESIYSKDVNTTRYKTIEIFPLSLSREGSGTESKSPVV